MRRCWVDWVAWFDRVAGGSPRCDEYIGLLVPEISSQVGRGNLRVVDIEENEASAAAGVIRVFHDDHHPDRVNVLVREGVVIAAAQF